MQPFPKPLPSSITRHANKTTHNNTANEQREKPNQRFHQMFMPCENDQSKCFNRIIKEYPQLTEGTVRLIEYSPGVRSPDIIRCHLSDDKVVDISESEMSLTLVSRVLRMRFKAEQGLVVKRIGWKPHPQHRTVMVWDNFSGDRQLPVLLYHVQVKLEKWRHSREIMICASHEIPSLHYSTILPDPPCVNLWTDSQ